MDKKRRYSLDELDVGNAAVFREQGGVFSHTHTIHFARPLTLAERMLFVDVLTGFYHTVHFSRRFGDGLVDVPVVEFPEDGIARYTLRQTALSGPWKELLLAILANFGHEVAPIRLHDDSRVFAPALSAVAPD
ncbi:MAG: hypothetical protein KF753_11455 [Caldilineaceae bacterium]|nr:hypothetical protein [Caldilineaceae bacterium]